MLSADQLESFNHNGYLVVEHVLADSDLEPLEMEYDALLDDYAKKLYRQGEIESPYSEYDFAERFARVVSQYPDCIDRMNISLPLINGKIDLEKFYAHTGPAVFGLLRNPKILDVVESVIGPEIASSPVQQMRIKLPLSELAEVSFTHSGVGNTTWHQDTVAVLPEAEDTNQLTVWIAVTEANEENGCLVSIPGSHLEGAHRHIPGEIPREPYVPAEIIGGRTGNALPVGRGGIIIFHKQNIHCSKPNRSNCLRWSLDVRYHPIGQASGRPAFPGFVARSRANSDSELRDPELWDEMWQDARMRVIRGEYQGPIFKDWNA